MISKLEDLNEIDGVGKATLNDILRVYDSLDELKEALKNDKVPLRNDVVEKLKKELI